MGMSLFGKRRAIGRDSRKEQVVKPVNSAPAIELTDEELEVIRGGHGHSHHHHHHRRYNYYNEHCYYDGCYEDDDD